MIKKEIWTDLLPKLHMLERHEKLFLIQFLVSDLAQEERATSATTCRIFDMDSIAFGRCGEYLNGTAQGK